MDGYGLTLFLAGALAAYDLLARNTLTGATRTVTVYAGDATAAYAKGFKTLDAESGDRSWCFDGFYRREH